MENHDSRKQQEREGRTVRMREKQAPNLQEPGDGSVQDTRHPGTRGADAGAHRFDVLHYEKQQPSRTTTYAQEAKQSSSSQARA